jgi:trigger factor
VKTNITEPSSTERVLDIEVERERFEKIFDTKLKKYSKEIRINGFRPGQVPKQVIATRFGESIKQETLEALVEEVLKEACKENNIETVGPGRLEKLENEPGKPILIKAVMEIDPPVEVKDYKLDIPVNPAEVSDADVATQIEGLRKRKGDELKVDRKAVLGDVVVYEYLKVVMDGTERPIPARSFRTELGIGNLKEMEDGLVGASAGEERSVTVNFPADYYQSDLAGKKAEYQLKILEVNEVRLPALDDEFAKGFGFESLDAFKARIREDLGKQALQRAKEEAYEQAMRQLMQKNDFDIPKARIQNYVNYKLQQQGHHHEPGEEHGHDHSDLEQEAVFNIKRYRLLEEIARKENIKAAQEDVDTRIRELADQYSTDFETLKASLRKSGKIVDIREELKSEKTLDFVIGFKG